MLPLLWACENLPESNDPPILTGVPTMLEVVDSLNNAGFQSIKWSIVDENVIYSDPLTVDWSKEFQAFLRDNVNKLRFKDAYSVTDSVINGSRHIAFNAKKETQEIKSVRIIINHGKVSHYSIIKERSNLFSSSKQSFSFDGLEYELSVEQSIRWFFDNKQFVHGSILPPGDVWLGKFLRVDGHIPFQIVLNAGENLQVRNAQELLSFNFTGTRGDSSVYESSFFNSHFIIKQVSDTTIVGRWVNAKYDIPRSQPLTASKNIPYRFKALQVPMVNISGEHRFYFYTEQNEIEDSALLVLNQNHQYLSGSLLTETGDYRYLEGVVRNDSFLLSTMDGTHSYLFEGNIYDQELQGVFKAGNTYAQKWSATLNTPLKFRAPESITQIKPESTFDFSFPDDEGNIVSLSDPQFKNKVVLVSIMGTWCSNCLDESLFLKELNNAYNQEKLAIVALDFEVVRDSLKSINNIKKYRTGLEIEYPILLACVGSNKDAAAKSLPSLTGIYSYPTLIILDKNHDVVKIHTGFSGPATGEKYYSVFKTEYRALISELIEK